MKYSIYNTKIEVTDSTLLIYNALNDRFLVVKKSMEEALRAGPDAVEKASPKLFTQMKEAGCIVEDDVDETATTFDKAIEHCSDDRTYQIIVNPTVNCNFRCWYCYEDHTGDTKMSTETVEKVKRLISHRIADPAVDDVNLSFFGGEPLLYYRDCVMPLIDHLRLCSEESGKGANISFTSNGYLLNDKVIAHLTEGSESKSFQITLDGHREHHNAVRHTSAGKGSYDRIVENIKKLLRAGINVILRINFTADNIESARDVLADLSDVTDDQRKLLNIDFQKVWQENAAVDKESVAEKVVEEFRKQFDRVEDYYTRIDSFRHPCYGDRTTCCVVNYNGDIYKCTARDFKSHRRLGRLGLDGTIQWDEENVLTERLRRKFANTTCLNCRIFPLCGGGCVQTSGEHGFKGCILHRTSEDKDRIILSRFYERVVKPNEKNENQSHPTA